jgi:hypothetical protein
VDEFLENLMKIGGILAIVCLPFAFFAYLTGSIESAAMGLTIGVIGLALYFIFGAIHDKNY